MDNHNLGKFDRPYKLNIFNIKENIASLNEIPRYERFWSNYTIGKVLFFGTKMIFKKFNSNHYSEDPSKNLLVWEVQRLKNINSWYIEGLFQSEIFFKEHKDIILNDFIFKKPLSEKTANIEKFMLKTNSVWVHIRRWDYLKKYWAKRLGVKWEDYYEQWIKYIKNNVSNPEFFFISDDIEWCKHKFWNIEKSYFIDWNYWEDDWQDMYLLHKCKHNIIGNSTFAWRWAYLNKNKNKIVIAPKKRDKTGNKQFDCIIPDSRITI